jgi:hypothetical protein
MVVLPLTTVKSIGVLGCYATYSLTKKVDQYYAIIPRELVNN